MLNRALTNRGAPWGCGKDGAKSDVGEMARWGEERNKTLRPMTLRGKRHERKGGRDVGEGRENSGSNGLALGRREWKWRVSKTRAKARRVAKTVRWGKRSGREGRMEGRQYGLESVYIDTLLWVVRNSGKKNMRRDIGDVSCQTHGEKMKTT